MVDYSFMSVMCSVSVKWPAINYRTARLQRVARRYIKTGAETFLNHFVQARRVAATRLVLPARGSPPHLNPFILGHPLHPPDSKVGFAEPRLRKKRSFAVLVRDIRTSPVMVAAVTVAAAAVVAQRGSQG